MATTKTRPQPRNQSARESRLRRHPATRKTDFINNLWRSLAFDPALLEGTWAEVKALMATPTTLDPLPRADHIAVSIANSCSYCVHSHTAAAKAKGMTDAQHAELLAIVSLAAKTNPSPMACAGAGGCRVRCWRGVVSRQ